MGITLETAITTQKRIFADCSRVVETKGRDYNREQQKSGDTLFNMRVAANNGLVRSPQKGVLVRISDKIQRLNSLENPAETPANKDEAVYDTVCDLINYATYFYMFYEEERRNIEAIGRTINAEAEEQIVEKARVKTEAAVMPQSNKERVVENEEPAPEVDDPAALTTIEAFLEKECVFGDEKEVKAEELLATYKAFCDYSKVEPNQSLLRKVLNGRKVTFTKKRNGLRSVVFCDGVNLKTQEPTPKDFEF